MTTYPRPNDQVHELTRADGTTGAHSDDHGRIIDVGENLKHFGASGNGVDDDTDAVEDWIEAADADGTRKMGLGFAPPGEYPIKRTIQTKHYTLLAGAGSKTQFINNVPASEPLFRLIPNQNQTRFRDFAIHGPHADAYGWAAGSGLGHGIQIDGGPSGGDYITNTTIDNVHFVGQAASGSCVYAVWGIETRIRDCQVLACYGGGFYLGSTCNASTVSDNTLSNDGVANDLPGMWFEDAQGPKVSGNIIENWKGPAAVRLTGILGGEFARNWLEGNQGGGVLDRPDLLLEESASNPNGANTFVNMGGEVLEVGARCNNNVFINSAFTSGFFSSTAAANKQFSARFINSHVTTLDTSGSLNTLDRLIFESSVGTQEDPTAQPRLDGIYTIAPNSVFGPQVSLDKGLIAMTERANVYGNFTPAANTVWLYATDNGSGKTGLYALGPSDAAVPLFVAGGIGAANPDTSGAILADLETEVNQLKAALRAAGIIAT